MKKKRPPGRPRKLTDEQVSDIRHAWNENIKAWQAHRKKPGCCPPHNLSMADLARRFRISEPLVARVLNRVGPYK